MKLQRKVYTTRREKIIDLVIGAGVFVILNILLTVIIVGLGMLAIRYADPLPDVVSNAIVLILNIMPYVLNLGLLLLFALWRPWIALGMLAAFAISVLITLCLAAIVGVACLWAVGGLGQ